MVEVVVDEPNFVPHAIALAPTIKTALWDFVGRIKENADHPDLIGTGDKQDPIGVQRGEYRASQFTSGWVLYWEVTRRQKTWLIDLSSGAPEEIKLWDVRALNPAP
jgi:hypothetical protein